MSWDTGVPLWNRLVLLVFCWFEESEVGAVSVATLSGAEVVSVATLSGAEAVSEPTLSGAGRLTPWLMAIAMDESFFSSWLFSLAVQPPDKSASLSSHLLYVLTFGSAFGLCIAIRIVWSSVWRVRFANRMQLGRCRIGGWSI